MDEPACPGRARAGRPGLGRAGAGAGAAPADDGPTTSARDRAWWGLGGLAGGVLLAAGWTRLRSTRTDRRDDDLDRDDAKDWLEPVSR